VTARSLIIGLALALGIAAFGYYNDSVLHLTLLVGNHLPISVFGLLIVATLALNPLLRRVSPRLLLRPPELAVVVTLALVACSIPGSGLMRTFVSTLTIPAQMNRQRPGWREQNVLDYAPDQMLVAGGEYHPEATEKFMARTGAEGEGFGLLEAFDTDNVPWHVWAEPLMTWMPLIVLTALCVVCLSLIVHRQWAHRERLRYPIALVASAIVEREPDQALGSVHRNRLFWIGLATVFVIHAVNGLAVLYPDQMIRIPLSFNFGPITQTWPKLWRPPHHWILFSPKLYPTVIAFAFFLAADVSFSLGVCQVLSVLVGTVLLAGGVEFRSDYMAGATVNFQLFGSCLGIGLLLLYTGRRYYRDVVRAAVTFRHDGGAGRAAAWAFRILLAAMVTMAILLVRLGLDWLLAVLVVLLILLMFVVQGRISAETGLFFLQPYWQPLAVLMGLFGLAALGPKVIVIVGLICAVLTIDPRESLMPFLLNGLKMCDDKRLRPARVAWASGATYLVALVVAVVVVFWASYNFGAPRNDVWAVRYVPRFTFQTASAAASKLEVSQQLGAAEGYGALDRVVAMDPQPEFLWAAGIGVLLVVAAGALRLRFTWWPLHPVIFLVWGTAPMSHFSFSFLLGWGVRTVVVRFGGARTRRKLVPLMIGVIAGDLLGGLLWMAHGAAYFGWTGRLLDATYRVFPG